MRFSAIILAVFAFWFAEPESEPLVAETPTEVVETNEIPNDDETNDSEIDEAEQGDDLGESESLVVIENRESSGLELANRQRANRSLGSLVPEPSLEALALERATRAARGRVRGHLGGNLGGASKEGIGYGPGRVFRACYLYTAPAGTKAGAAIVQGSDGWFYSCLLLDYPGSLSSGSGNARRGFRVFRFRR